MFPIGLSFIAGCSFVVFFFYVYRVLCVDLKNCAERESSPGVHKNLSKCHISKTACGFHDFFFKCVVKFAAPKISFVGIMINCKTNEK